MSTQTIDIDTLAAQLLADASNHRRLVALAGAPGSGKSTLAVRLVNQLNRTKPDCAALLPMDGYHFDDRLLTNLGRLAHKGAPDTFDVDGLRHMLLRLRANAEANIAVPVFDRSIEIARAGAELIPQQAAIIVVEGNYLLLRDMPWAALRPLFDTSLFIDTSRETLRQRLTARWQGYGLPAEEIRRKVEDNDLPNAEFVLTHSIAADYRLPN